MDVDKLIALAKWAETGDKVVVECDGYELEPYAIETDEFEGVLRIKCFALDDDEEEEATWAQGAACDVPERPMESLDISELDVKEG